MFKITCFAPIEPKKLGEVLKGIHFRTVKGCFEWSLDGHIFRIEPFQNQPRDSMKAYRIFFDGDITGGSYLYDLSIGCMSPIVTGVEFDLDHSNMNSSDWIDQIGKLPSYKMLDARGIFEKDGVGIIVVNNQVTLQLRSRKNKKLIMLDCLKKIDSIREELTPNRFDLFSFEGIAV